jgi:pimeloyl-ACP methyl ester carboxylesterase
MVFFPFSTQLASIDGLKVRYCIAGEGKPLVLVHGLAAMLEYWFANIPDLSKHYKVITFDLPGFGQSDSPSEYSIDFYTDFINHLLDFLGIQSTYLVGHSLGGALALRYAMLSTERVKKLVLLNNVGFATQLSWQFRLLTLPGIDKLMRRGFTQEQYGVMLRSHAFNPNSIPDAFIEATFPIASNQANLSSFLKVLKENAWIGGIKERSLHEIRNHFHLVQSLPTQIYWGEEDTILPYKPHVKAAQKWMPWAPIISLKQCGHLSQIEHSQLVNHSIIEFLG